MQDTDTDTANAPEDVPETKLSANEDATVSVVVAFLGGLVAAIPVYFLTCWIIASIDPFGPRVTAIGTVVDVDIETRHHSRGGPSNPYAVVFDFGPGERAEVSGIPEVAPVVEIGRQYEVQKSAWTGEIMAVKLDNEFLGKGQGLGIPCRILGAAAFAFVGWLLTSLVTHSVPRPNDRPHRAYDAYSLSAMSGVAVGVWRACSQVLI